jgi:hypothetical protein
MKDMKVRDEIVKAQIADLGIPVAVTLAGGYAVDIADTVSIHSNTVMVFLDPDK